MNRKSLGADIYSPIRFDVSLNDSAASSGSISEVFGASFNSGFKKDSRKSLETIQDEEFCEQQVKEAAGFSQASSDKNNSKSKRPTNLPLPKQKDTISPRCADDIFGTSPINHVFLGPEPSKQEHITPKKSPRTTRSNKQNTEKQDKLVTKRSSRSKAVPSKFITVRKDSNRSNLTAESTETASPDLVQFGDSIEKNLGLKEADVRTSVDFSTQTDLTMKDLQMLMKKADLKSTSENKRGGAVKMSSEVTLADTANVPSQLQANALEKLKDTISEEFHGLRQLLYLQQISLGRILNKNLDGTNEVLEGLNNMFSLLNDQQLTNAALSHRFNC
ncbi:hypothetical protein JTE90_019578 [Oedothorax gibbosus]|uniref:Uncharacterized protein n=1 Tax=Oedothorax gibbosus TaxID=931172 RepID=A0AAV6V6E5_9ARAC|nr:hypothetical protein JTE90_019578 [Oedothorax gibbosus]